MLPISHTITQCDRERIYRIAAELKTKPGTIEDILWDVEGETGIILDAIELLGYEDIEAIVAYMDCGETDLEEAV